MWIMVAGPYSSAEADAEARAANRRVLHAASLALFRRGHVPVIGVDVALPLIACAGPDSYDSIMMPLSLALAERCDACLRVGGASQGADQEVARFRARGKPVWFRLEDVPEADSG
jgi:hypothetical protein